MSFGQFVVLVIGVFAGAMMVAIAVCPSRLASGFVALGAGTAIVCAAVIAGRHRDGREL